MEKINQAINQAIKKSQQTTSPSKGPNSEIASWVEEISFVIPIPRERSKPWGWGYWTGRIKKMFAAKDRRTFHKILKETKEFPVLKRGAVLNNKIKESGY